MSHKTRWWALLALGVAAMFFLAACDSDDDEMDDTTTPAASESTSTPEDTMTPEGTPEDMTPEASPTEEMDDMSGDSTVAVATEGDHAPRLVDGAGMTLYTFANDEDGVSNCTEGCLTNWPPLLVEDGAEATGDEGVTGELGVIERADGEGMQVTYNGMPLYYWQGDQAPGDTSGHGVGDAWFVVHPDGDSAMSLDSSATAEAASSEANYGY